MYLYKNEVWLCFLTLAVCVFTFCIYIQWGKGTRVVTWLLGAAGVGAVVLGMASPFLSAGRTASFGSGYACLAGALAVMLNASRKLRGERRGGGTRAS